MVFMLQLIGIIFLVILFLILLYHILITMLDFAIVFSIIGISFYVGMLNNSSLVGIGMFAVCVFILYIIAEINSYLTKVKVMSEESLSSLITRKLDAYNQKELGKFPKEKLTTKELAIRLQDNSLKLQNYSLEEIQESLSKMKKEITKEEYSKLGGNTNPALMKTEIHNGVWVYYKNICLIR